MVLDEKLRPLHELTEDGKRKYIDLLEKTADEILFKHQHPLKWAIMKAKEIFNKEDES